MTIWHEIPLQPAFHDLDIMNIVWHGHYLKYFELGRCALMKQLHLDWPVLRDLGFAMPVVDAQVKYRKPLVYDLELVVRAEIAVFELPALDIAYSILDRERRQVHATGLTRQTYFDTREQKTCFMVPEVILERFLRYGANP